MSDNVVITSIIRKFKSYIRVIGALVLLAGVNEVLPITDLHWAIVLGVFILALLLVGVLLDMVIAALAGAAAGAVGSTEADDE